MNERQLTRHLRKQALQLQARRYRLSMREDISALADPFTHSASEAGQSLLRGHWAEILSSLLSLLPGRWSRILSVGSVAWQLLQRVRAKRSAQAAEGAAQAAETGTQENAH
jgi:hypothetical protein